MGRIAPLLLVVLLVPWRPCAAGAGEGRGEFGFDFGGTRFDTNVTGARADRLDLRGGYHFTRHFELEGTWGASGASEISAGVERTISLSTLFVNGVLELPSRGGAIVAYALAGVGGAELKFRAQGGSSLDRSLAGQIAAGSRFFLSRDRGIAALVEGALVEERTFGQSSRHALLVVGLTFRFGSK